MNYELFSCAWLSPEIAMNPLIIIKCIMGKIPRDYLKLPCARPISTWKYTHKHTQINTNTHTYIYMINNAKYLGP